MIAVRVVVVGSGVIGLLTAVECVRAGAWVDLVDRDGIPSTGAASFDRLRVARALHRGDAGLTAAAARAQESWLEAESQLGTRFCHPVGALTAMPPTETAASLELLTAAGVTAQAISPGGLASRYPLVRFPAGLAAVLEPGAGVIRADRALLAAARWLRARPRVRLHAHRRVTGISDAGRVRLADGTELAGDVVVAATGPWSRELLPTGLGGDLTLYRQTVLSYAPVPSPAVWAGLPAIPALGTASGAWLMPPVASAPARLSAASACRPVADMTDHTAPEHWRAQLAGIFRPLLAGFDPAAITGASDGYYLAASGGGPLLAVGGGGTVLVYAACGGMSFKLAPLIAGSLAGRALGRAPLPTGLTAVDRPQGFAARYEDVA